MINGIMYKIALGTGQKLNAEQQVSRFEVKVVEQMPEMVETVSEQRLFSTQVRLAL